MTADERGFTLIELLVVIAIVAVLAALALAAMFSAQKGSRDSVRRSDLHQMRVATHNYARDNDGSGPIRTVEVNIDTLAELTAGNYVTSFPSPVGSVDTYRYVSSVDGVQYGFCTNLEKDAGKMINQTPTHVDVVAAGSCVVDD